MLKASQLGLGIITQFLVISKLVFNVVLIFWSSLGFLCMTAGSAPGTTQNMNRSNRFTGGISSPVLGWVVLFIYIFGVCLSGLGFIHLFLGMVFCFSLAPSAAGGRGGAFCAAGYTALSPCSVQGEKKMQSLCFKFSNF